MGVLVYNAAMQKGRFHELKSYIGFGSTDAENLRLLSAPAEAFIGPVRDRFYEVLLQHPGAREIFSSPDQVERQKDAFVVWLRGLFSGPYDEEYLESRLRIGRTHVRVGLPQRYMPLAMEVVRAEFARRFRAARLDRVEEKLESLCKLLTLDLTIMLGSFQDSYSGRIRDFERKVMEGKLAQAEHMAEIGQLAASLAHEIKNPLAGISGAIQIIGESLDTASPFKGVIGEILGQISRLDATVKDLLLYARPTPPDRKLVRLPDLIGRLCTVLREEPALRNVEIQYNGDGAVAFADERQLEQLLINLILNAAHASSSGTPVLVSAVERADRLVLAVKDSGTGMPEEVRRKALEPFFTTKAKGTGLGLAICRRIAEAHGGMIAINSRVGAGTTVTVEIPRLDKSL